MGGRGGGRDREKQQKEIEADKGSVVRYVRPSLNHIQCYEARAQNVIKMVEEVARFSDLQIARDREHRSTINMDIEQPAPRNSFLFLCVLHVHSSLSRVYECSTRFYRDTSL